MATRRLRPQPTGSQTNLGANTPRPAANVCVTISDLKTEERKQKLSRYRKKKIKRNFDRKIKEGSGRQPAKSAREICQDRRMQPAEAKKVDPRLHFWILVSTTRNIQRQHEWLPKGWVMEVRAGGEKADKMYKFYVHSITGLRLLSKQDILLYINEAKVSGCDTNGQCDTTSEDNILSKVDFRPSGLPEGWVKELVYRKTKEGLIKRDPYYTDPASFYTFRTLKSALSFLETGKVSERAFIQRTSVHDLYSFEISADMVIVLLVFSLSSENLHDILCSSCLHFGHYHAEIKGSEFCFLAT
ncbi:OSJNBb0058J09.3-like protein [Zea mays]|uniref:OSJNBb0058J09.3-like protein n=2 Tax=Zea mays TaxID=4577 RepID=A0A1D6MVJ4_MAIZE|nr:OSJNBb0058J09.3-like protein [Zea mays]